MFAEGALDRGSEDVAPIVHLMESQHASIEEISLEIRMTSEVWRSSATAESRDALANALDRMVYRLNEHARLEEERIRASVEKYVTSQQRSIRG